MSGDRGEVEAHPDPDKQQALAVVGELLAEGELHQLRAGDQDDDDDKSCEGEDAEQDHPHRVVELASAVGVLARLESGEVGQDAGRDRLEELQRRPREHQDVEDETGGGGALESARDQRPRVEEGLFGEHDHEHGRGEATAGSEGEILLRHVLSFASGHAG